MNTHFILVHENGDGSPTVKAFDDRKSSRTAFKKIDTGIVTLYELRRSQAVKRANFDIVHRENKNALTKKTDAQLRAEARKRKLTIADNPQATRDQIINEIQQHELTDRLAHRRPLSSTASPAKPDEGAPVAYESQSVADLHSLAEKRGLEIPSKATKPEIIAALEKDNSSSAQPPPLPKE